MEVGTEEMPEYGGLSARDENRKLALLIAIEKIEKPHQQDLADAIGVPERSILFLTQSLNKVGVVIERVNGKRYGYYEITDTGIFNTDRLPEIVKMSHPALLQQIEQYAKGKKAASKASAAAKRKKQTAAEGRRRMKGFLDLSKPPEKENSVCR